MGVRAGGKKDACTPFQHPTPKIVHKVFFIFESSIASLVTPCQKVSPASQPLQFSLRKIIKILKNKYFSRQIADNNVPSKLRGCAAAQYFRSAAHLISIDYKANTYVLQSSAQTAFRSAHTRRALRGNVV